MNASFLKIIIAVFVILAGMTFFPTIFGKPTANESLDQKNLSVDLSKFSVDSVKKMVIANKGEDENVLSIRNGKWFIGDTEADLEKVNQLFADFSDMKVEDVVSQNSENQAKLEVTKETGIQLTFSADGGDAVFFIGGTTAPSGTFFIRKDGIKNVYRASGTLRTMLLQSADDWKKKADESSKAPESSESKSIQ